MRIGLFRRIASYLMDAIPIIFVLSILFSLFVGNLLQPDNYDDIKAEYEQNQEVYFDTLEGYYDQFDEGLITEEQLQTKEELLLEAFLSDNSDLEDVIYTFYTNSVLYYYLGFTLVYLIYVVSTKGQTFGRRFLKIQLSGRVNIWTVILRDVLWKHI